MSFIALGISVAGSVGVGLWQHKQQKKLEKKEVRKCLRVYVIH